VILWLIELVSCVYFELLLYREVVIVCRVRLLDIVEVCVCVAMSW
jgi:hypothetical protein